MIEVEKVTKRFGPVLAVDEVSLAMSEGEIVGFLGPNGAGKSTLLKMLCTWLPPSAGALRVGGHDVVREPLEVRRLVGYLPEHNALYEGMKVDRFLVFCGGMRGLEGARLRDRLDWVVERCGLDAVLGKWVHQCSKGYRQRIGLAAALIHDPPILLLDEPTHGLDPLQVAAFREFVAALRPGRAILFSSHILSEVIAVSDRLLVIHQGRLLADDAVAAFAERARSAGTGLEEILLGLFRAREAAP